MKLSLQMISKSFDENLVLNNVSFHVNNGEFVTLLGPSGSGKSTLFHLIGGMMSPDEGTIYLNGENVNGKRGLISYMPQQHSLLPWRTVLQNVVFGQEFSKKPDLEKAREWLNKVGLGSYEKSYPYQLSGGMKQRVAFIRALMSPQPFMCFDEPFSALDEFTRADMQQWLLSIWEQDRRSILFVTHSIDEAIFMSDRIYILSARPATVLKEIQIAFPRPRGKELMLSNEFLTYKRDIYESLQRTKGELVLNENH
ncbi:ABC transporter ATP-binding protein [Metabacillus arenae]|uniref:ABC transporter ATP-binding protein n=1 Tax=Metabacillus arenae TaxID=2771434 RepID=A0A926NGU1_9BACI|nr:ABC transporter ATP-binding protein [Metabacillus arenae]MBD1380278.1 ABC transporter ATP-binding protein [Metabacillus arenae]